MRERSERTDVAAERSEQTNVAAERTHVAVERPVLRVVTGEASDEELAALLTVVLARTAPAAEQRPARAGWADPAARVRQPLPAGFGAWRSGSLR